MFVLLQWSINQCADSSYSFSQQCPCTCHIPYWVLYGIPIDSRDKTKICILFIQWYLSQQKSNNTRYLTTNTLYGDFLKDTLYIYSNIYETEYCDRISEGRDNKCFEPYRRMSSCKMVRGERYIFTEFLNTWLLTRHVFFFTIRK